MLFTLIFSLVNVIQKIIRITVSSCKYIMYGAEDDVSGMFPDYQIGFPISIITVV